MLTMAKTTITTDIHQSFNIQLNLRTKRPLHFDFFIDDISNSSKLFVIPFFYFYIVIDAYLVQNVLGGRTADSVNIRETNFPPLVFRYIYTRDPCHIIPKRLLLL